MSLAVVGAVALSATAWAGSPNITADDDFFVNDFYEVGESLQATFTNDGDSTHNVTADEDGPDGGPLFRTGNVSGGEGPVAVSGSEYLDADSYPFHCSIHPEMQATLVVFNTPSGPVARPEIDVAIKSKKLEKVVKSGKLKVQVSAAGPTDADGVSLSAKKGRKGITKKRSVDVNAGNTDTVKLRLKKKAADKLADLDKAKVRLTAEVDFGSPAKASKKLK